MVTLLPAIIFLFMIGWYISLLGNDEKAGKKQNKPPKEDNVSILPIIFEENQEITNE
jgi:hypothetical protein